MGDEGTCFDNGDGSSTCQPVCSASFAGECVCGDEVCPQANMCKRAGEADETCEPFENSWLGALLIIGGFLLVMALAAVWFRQKPDEDAGSGQVGMEMQEPTKAGAATSQTADKTC